MTGRTTLLALLRLAAVSALLFAGKVALAADRLDIADSFCTLATQSDLGAEDIAARTASLDCGRDRFSRKARYLWAYAVLPAQAFPAGALRFEGDSPPFDGLMLQVWRADGSVASRHFSATEIAAHWTAGTRFSVPLSDAGSRPVAVAARFENLWSTSTVATAEIMTEERAREERLSRLVTLALYCGFAAVPIIYSLAFFFVLRHRFMLLHAAMSACVVAYTFSSSNLIMHFVPGTDLWTRTLMSYCALALAGALSGFFMTAFMEAGAIGRRLRDVVHASAAILLGTCLFMVTLAPELPFTARNIYHASFVPMIACILFALVIGLRRGSRAARFIAIGWGALILGAFDRIARGLDLYVAPNEFDFALYFGLVFEAIVTALGVADRVIMLKRERDMALQREARLTELAETDDLTGLYNRRTLEARFDELGARGSKRALAIIDIDHFKAINDSFGHLVGDRVLCALASALRTHCGAAATAARIGGEEFAIVYVVDSPGLLRSRIAALRSEIARSIAAEVPELGRPVTVSAGVAVATGLGFADAHLAADVLLYNAKRSGRDRASFREDLAVAA